MVLADFWENFFLFLIFLPLVLLWAFALVDIFRRDDIGGGWKALWVVCVILVPFFGTLIYLITRPPGATKEERVALDAASRDFVSKYSPDDRAAQLQTLSDLHDRGKLTDAEFDAEKSRILGGGPVESRPVTT
jgi:Phospholipase_D-nuclease N-terminal/Short C-terminal domain